MGSSNIATLYRKECPMKKHLALTTLALLIASGARATTVTFTWVDCLSQATTTDLTIRLIDTTTTEYAYLFDRFQGTHMDLTKGQVQQYTESRFTYTASEGAKPLSIDIDMNSTEENNGVLKYNGKTTKVQCFVSDTVIEDYPVELLKKK
jgi:hypothetical protein